MSLKQVFFRKMTILYVVLIGLLSFELFVVGPNTIQLKTDIDTQVSSTPYVITYEKEQKEIKGAKIEERVKTANRLMKVDESLTGNQCIVSSDFMFMGQDQPFVLNEEPKVQCSIKEYRAFNKLFPYEVLVSQETYNLIQDKNYSYLVYFKSLSDFNRAESDDKVIDIRQPLVFALDDFYSEDILFHENLVIVGLSIVMLFVVIAVLFFNTSYYVKSNTKKTRKKVKDNSLTITIKSVTLTILFGISIGYVIPHIMSLL